MRSPDSESRATEGLRFFPPAKGAKKSDNGEWIIDNGQLPEPRIKEGKCVEGSEEFKELPVGGCRHQAELK